jgi:hypothetical protein
MSCTDVQTIQAGNGTKTQFSFDFPYIFKSEIHVYFWNATTKEYDEKLTTDGTYPWRITDANPTIVEFTSTAPPAPATPVDPGEPTVDNVKIRRITQIDDIRALFNPGSAIRSDDLNNNFEQLKYAIQESNCPGIPDDVDQYLKDYYWDRYDNTLYAGDTWVSNDTKIATTAALDARFQDEVNDTFTKAELAAASDVMPDNDNAVPTTGALKNFTDHVIENDILVDNTGLNKTTTNGQVTIGISANSVDFDRIKSVDKVQLADQEADYDLTGGDTKVFTASAAIRRFENYVQNSTPSGTGVGKGAVWVDIADDKTLSVWDGTAWQPIASGGTFTEQPKVVYVDVNGSDSNDGHRISRPKRTIKAAINQINADSTYGDGSTVIVAAGVYQEAAPIQIQKKNVSIIGQALRSCVVHPTVASQGDQSGGNHALFELNSGSFIQNLTLTGMKANNSGTNTLDSTLPSNQGWNFAFYSGATIYKSPYIQNCTNFSDSEIDNSNLNAEQPAGGLAGDTDSAPTGGGMLVDGAVLNSASPLRSMVADSYTHVGLNGPGILVVNNGYTQITSSYAFFNKYHIKCLNGGQANLAASTTDFGDQGLVADGKSTSAIFTSNVDGAASSGATSFNINEPTAGTGWFGDAERPGTNMLVEVNSVIYPILSATARTDSEGNNGWTVTISRPNPSNRSENLGLNGAISDNAAVSFYLRSMIASSGHTMEYVGSGTDYRALPENGGVPNESKQKIELNNGKIWTAVTDHNGKFTVGGNQTDDPFFEVDQQLGFVTIPEGSIAFNLLSDLTPQLGGNLDVNSKEIVSTSNGNIIIKPNGTGKVGIGTSSPAVKLDISGKARSNSTVASDAGTTLVTKDYLDNTSYWERDAATNTLSPKEGNDNVNVGDNAILLKSNSGDAHFLGNVGIGTTSPGAPLEINNASPRIRLRDSDGTNTYSEVAAATGDLYLSSRNDAANGQFIFQGTGGGTADEHMRIDTSGRLLVGRSSTSSYPNFNGTTVNPLLQVTSDADAEVGILLRFNSAGAGSDRGATFCFQRYTDGTSVSDGKNLGEITWQGEHDGSNTIAAASIRAHVDGTSGSSDMPGRLVFSTTADGASSPTERMYIVSNGNVGIGTTDPQTSLHVNSTAATGIRSHASNTQTTDTNKAFKVTNGNNTETFNVSYRGGGFFAGQVFFGTESSSDLTTGAANAKRIDSTSVVMLSSRDSTASRNHHAFYNPNGQVGTISTNGSATVYSTSSDYRLKENITPMVGAADRVKALKPCRFNFIADASKTVDGFLAHEVQTIVPEAITGEKDAVDNEGNPEYQGIDQAKLVPLLTAALQEALAKIDDLEARLTAAGL